MHISSKTLATLLVVTAIAAAVPGISRVPGNKRRYESQFDRLLQRHDRKAELRASVLGLHPLEFRDMQKRMSFDEIRRKKGFATTRAFRIALMGKIKDELRLRGWNTRRIEKYMITRSHRLS